MEKEVRSFLRGRETAPSRWGRRPVEERNARLEVRAALDRLLDDAHSSLFRGSTVNAVASLATGLRRIRMIVTAEEWQECIDRCMAHRICKLLHHDPLTRHASESTMERIDDAIVTDYVLDEEPAAHFDEHVSAIGRGVHLEVVNGTWAGALRYRRRFAAQTIDECAVTSSSLRVLAIGGGKMQELQQSLAFRNGAVGEIVAADRETAEVFRAAAPARVTTLPCSAAEFAGGEADCGRFDLVYAMNALDVADNATAAALVRRMFDVLTPGGMLVVTSLLPDLSDGAFVEAFFGHRLYYRTAFEVLELTRGLGRRAATRLGADETSSVVFAAVRRVAV